MIGIISLIIAVIFYRDFAHKISDLYKFYLIICEYNISKKESINILITILLVAMELIISIGIIFYKTRVIFLIIGIFLEVIYLFIIGKNYGRKIKSGCNCFILNNSIEIDNKILIKIGCTIFAFTSMILMTIY